MNIYPPLEHLRPLIDVFPTVLKGLNDGLDRGYPKEMTESQSTTSKVPVVGTLLLKKAGRGSQNGVSGPGGDDDQPNHDTSSLGEKGLPVRSLESVAVDLYIFLKKESQEEKLIPCEVE